MPAFRIDEAYLIGGWCAAAVWGVFTFLMAFVVVQIIQLQARGRMSRSKWITAAATILLYCLSTIHISLALQRLITGFIWLQGPDTLPYFADIPQPLNRAKDVIYITNMVIADLVVVWRCYVVWDSNMYVLSILSVCVLATAVTGYGGVAQYFVEPHHPAEAVRFADAMFSISLATNVIVTSLTVGRIWWIAHNLSRYLGRSFQSKYRTILLLLLESGLIIAIAKLIEFILFQAATESGRDGFSALYIIFEVIPQINGVVPTLIIVAVNASKTMPDTDYETSMGAPRTPSQGITVHTSTLVYPTQRKPTRTVTGNGSASQLGKDGVLDYRNSDEEFTDIPLGELRFSTASEHGARPHGVEPVASLTSSLNPLSTGDSII